MLLQRIDIQFNALFFFTQLRLLGIMIGLLEITEILFFPYFCIRKIIITFAT